MKNPSLFILFSALFLALCYATCPDLPTPAIYSSLSSQFVIASPKTTNNKTVVVKNVFQNPVYQDRDYNVLTGSFPLELYQAAYLRYLPFYPFFFSFLYHLFHVDNIYSFLIF